MQKECIVCGKVYDKKVNCSLKKWSQSKCCSLKCYWINRKGLAPWNKDLKGIHLSPKSEFKKGHIQLDGFTKGHTPWNKGLPVRLSPNSEFKKGDNAEEKNLNWKGEEASYRSKHAWVRRYKGTPSKCEHCGRTDKKKYEWANIDHKYRRKLEDYIRLCTSCHRKYDNAMEN